MEHKNTKERYNLPDKVEFCKTCTISNQRPRIIFDESGVCSACRYSEYKDNVINWEEREKELVEMLKKHNVIIQEN
jgi:hypothetical protein